MLKAFEIIQAVGIEYMIENGKEEELKKVNADSLVIVGMMSHMCIDTTVGEAQNYDYKVTVIHDTCTTKDLEWNGEKIKASTVHKSIMVSLNDMFAEVLSSEEYLKL